MSPIKTNNENFYYLECAALWVQWNRRTVAIILATELTSSIILGSTLLGVAGIAFGIMAFYFAGRNVIRELPIADIRSMIEPRFQDKGLRRAELATELFLRFVNGEFKNNPEICNWARKKLFNDHYYHHKIAITIAYETNYRADVMVGYFPVYKSAEERVIFWEAKKGLASLCFDDNFEDFKYLRFIFEKAVQ